MSDEKELVNFVRGMALHDIGKPLYLASSKHTLLGYVLLRALGREAEALVALAHWYPRKQPEEQIKIHFACEAQRDPGAQLRELPGYLVLSNALDVIASVTYSLYEDEPKDIRNPSTQNPFSRSRAVAQINGNPVRIGVTGDAGDLCKEIFRADFEDFVTNALNADASQRLDDLMAGESRTFTKRVIQNLGLIDRVIQDMEQIDPEKLQQKLSYYLDHFGERTYPTPNDTSLAQHTRLSSILASVVYAKLLNNKESTFLQKRIQQARNGTILLDSEPLGDYLASPNSDDNLPSQAQLVAAKHLSYHLIRVSFSGFEDLFRNAVRLDDLIGVRELMEGKGPGGDQLSLKEAYKQGFAARLRVDELWEDIVLSEQLFDLIYLLPDCHNLADIETHIVNAHRAAVTRLVEERLMPLIRRDFQDVPDLDLAARSEELTEQLQALLVTWAHASVNEPVSENDNFQHWMRAFGDKLLMAYRDVQKQVSLPVGEIVTIKKQAQTIMGSEEEICEVCGGNPIFADFNRLVPQRRLLQKVVRQRGDRFEQVCLACIAIRVLSHGLIEVKALQDMVKKVDTRIEVRKPPDSPLDLPPLMHRWADLEEEEGFADLVAAFVRETRDPKKIAESVDLDVFPTVAYAADADSNVALIALRPCDDGVFGCYEPGRMSDLGLFKLRDLLDQHRHLFPSKLGPIRGLIEQLSPDKAALATVCTHLQSLVEDADVKEILSAYEQTNQGITAAADIALPSFPLGDALEELGRLSDSAYRERLVDKETVALVYRKLESLLTQNTASLVSPLLVENDLEEFDIFYRKPLSEIDGRMDKQVQEQARVAEPHIARVFQRMEWIQRFYSQLPHDLEAAGIRVLPIQTRYPEPLYLVPADCLPVASHVLHKSLATRLFSSRLYNFLPQDGDNPEERTRTVVGRLATLLFLSRVLPKLLYGAVIVFKHKQPLYMVLEAARNMIEELDRLRLDREKGLDWSGILFGFADLRGVISERGLVQTRPPFGEMYQAIEISQKPQVDRRSLLSTMAMLKGEEPWEVEKLPEEGELPDIVGATLHLRGKRQRWDKETLGLLQKNRYFKPTVFLKRMAR